MKSVLVKIFNSKDYKDLEIQINNFLIENIHTVKFIDVKSLESKNKNELNAILIYENEPKYL